MPSCSVLCQWEQWQQQMSNIDGVGVARVTGLISSTRVGDHHLVEEDHNIDVDNEDDDVTVCVHLTRPGPG